MPNWLIFGIMAVAFTFVLASAQAAYWWYISRQERLQEELLRRIAGGTTEDGRLESLIRESEGDAAAQALGGLGATMQEYITSADAGITVTNLVTQMAVAAAIGALAGFFVLQSVIGLVAAIPAGYGPYFLLQYRAAKRSAKLVEQLPDALDLIARALQAGVGLSDAFRLAAEEMAPPLSIEFSRVFEEIRFGRDYREAFQTMIKRNPKVFDMRLMVSSILLARETGGNLIEILENISETIRARFTFFAKVQAMTSEARFTAIILGSLPFGVICVLLFMSPDYMTPMLDTFVGKILASGAAFVYMAGVLIMRDMSKVEV
jgi:tight adherence protein B